MGLETAGGFLGQAVAEPATATYALWVSDGSGIAVDAAIDLWRRVIAERGYEQAGLVALRTADDGGVYAVGGVRPSRPTGLPPLR